MTRERFRDSSGAATAPEQQELVFPVPPTVSEEPLLPARMVNEFAYCPRLAYLEWVQGEWAESADGVDGRYRHRRVDHPAGELAGAEDLDNGNGCTPAR